MYRSLQRASAAAGAEASAEAAAAAVQAAVWRAAPDKDRVAVLAARPCTALVSVAEGAATAWSWPDRLGCVCSRATQTTVLRGQGGPPAATLRQRSGMSPSGVGSMW